MSEAQDNNPATVKIKMNVHKCVCQQDQLMKRYRIKPELSKELSVQPGKFLSARIQVLLLTHCRLTINSENIHLFLSACTAATQMEHIKSIKKWQIPSRLQW